MRSVQARHADGSIVTEQHADVARPVVEPTAAGARQLGTAYWDEIQRFTRGIVRARERDGGVELRTGPGGLLTLFAFGVPHLTVGPTAVAVTFPIAGGALVRRGGGTISLGQETGRATVLVVRVEGYQPTLGAPPGAPRWTGLLYHGVQARLHERISARFFARLVAGSGG